MSEKIPKDWKKVKLGEIVKDIIDNRGKNPPYFVNSGIPVIDNFMIKNSMFIDLSEANRFIDENVFDTFIRKYLKNGDVLITLVGNGYGNVALAPTTKSVIIQNTIGLRFDDNISKFMFYWCLCKKSIVRSLDRGSVQPSIKVKDLLALKIEIPESLEEQKAIASVLSSLDNKIDLLHRQNKTLEQMAETLFRQWFIEEAKEDWEEVSLGNSNLAKIIKSGIDKFEGEKIYLATGDVNDTEIIGGNKIKYNKRPSRANMQPVKFSVWFAKKGGVRKLLMFDDYSDIDNTILSTGFTGLKTTELSHYYIWCFVLLDEFQEIKDSFVSGTVQPDINNDGVLQIMIPNPDEESLKKFNEIVRPLFTKIQANNNQIRTLEKLRNTLLPKLMSGKVRVKL